MTAEEPEFDREAYRQVRSRFQGLVDAGGRFIALVVRDQGGTLELIYAFDLGHKVESFRFTVLPEWEIDSVAEIYPGAMVAEREAVDLFGVKFKGVLPGVFLEKGRSPTEPLRKRPAAGKEVGSDG